MNNNNLQTTQRTQRTKRLAAINALEKIKHLSQQHITKDKTNLDSDASDSDDFYSDSDESDSDNVKLKTKTKTKHIKQQHTVTTSASIINIININNIEDPNLFCPFCLDCVIEHCTKKLIVYHDYNTTNEICDVNIKNILSRKSIYGKKLYQSPENYYPKANQILITHDINNLNEELLMCSDVIHFTHVFK